MGYGGGIFLIAAGAILAFAIRVELWWVDVESVGVVLMIAGGAVLVLTAWSSYEERRRVRWSSATHTADPRTVLLPAALPPPAEAAPLRWPPVAAPAVVPPVTGRPPPPTPTPPTPPQAPQFSPPAE